MPHYNSDYMHCCASSCKRKDECWRYWLGQQKVSGFVLMYFPDEPVVECEHFLNIKDY